MRNDDNVTMKNVNQMFQVAVYKLFMKLRNLHIYSSAVNKKTLMHMQMYCEYTVNPFKPLYSVPANTTRAERKEFPATIYQQKTLQINCRDSGRDARVGVLLCFQLRSYGIC